MVQRSFTLLFLLLSIYYGSISCASAQNSEQLYLSGLEKSKQGKHKEALTLFNSAIRLNEKEARYYAERGKSYMHTAEVESAFNDFCTAIKIDPTYPDAYLSRGIFFQMARQPEKAILDITEGLKFAKIDSSIVKLLIVRASCYHQKRDFEAAEKDCRQALTIDSLHVGAMNNLAMALDELGHHPEAIRYLKKIISVDNKAVFAYMNIGFYLSKQGEYKESIPYFNQAIALDPQEASVYNNRGYSEFKLKDYDSALKDVCKSIKMNPYNSYAYRNRSLIYLDQHKKAKACEDLNQAKQLGFTKQFGPEVETLLKENCVN